MVKTRWWRALVAPVAVTVAVVAVAPACTRGGSGPGPGTTVLGAPGETFQPVRINDRGQVLGLHLTAAGNRVSLYERGRVTPVIPLGADEEIDMHTFLNERGDVVTTVVSVTDTSVLRTVFWRDGRAVDLGPEAAGFTPMRLDEQGNVLLYRYRPDDPAVPDAIIWRDGVVTPAPAPPAGFRETRRTADGRLVAGTITRPDGAQEAAVWQPGGAVTPLGVSDLPGGGSSVHELTDTGIVVGRRTGPEPWRDRLFTWTQDTGRVDLGVPDGISEDHLLHFAGVGTSGHIVVTVVEWDSQEPHLFLWRPSGWTRIGGGDLSLRTNNVGSQVINDKDQLLLTRRDPEHRGDVPVVWSDGRLIELAVAGASPWSTEAIGLNRRGQVAGSFDVGEWPEERLVGVIWTVPELRS